MIAQLDLIEYLERAPAPTPAPKRDPLAELDPLTLLPARPVQWERLLDRATEKSLTIMVCTMWTGMVVETLSDSELGYFFLYKDGEIIEMPRQTVFGRTVFLTLAAARRIHARAPFVILGSPGTHGVRLRFAGDADTVADPFASLIET
ncbi:MAG TPA: hypothetical protein VMA37_08775 [Acetobacteraceae bacterium]|nr:hypothetical protein [Acetobacteraceae bacterium]